MATSPLKRVATHQLVEICRSRSIAIVFVKRHKSNQTSDNVNEQLKKEHGQKSLHTEVAVKKETSTNIDFWDMLARELRNSSQLRACHHLNYSELSSRLALLLNLGCSIQQILENVVILTVKEDEILHRAKYAKSEIYKQGATNTSDCLGQEFFQSAITVEILLKAGSQDFFREVVSQEALDHHLHQCLECTSYQLAVLMKKYPSLIKIRGLTPEKLNQRMDIIRQYGATIQDVRAAPYVLNLDAEKLKCRMQQLKELKDQGKLQFDKWPLNTVGETDATFNVRIKRALKYSAFIDGSPINFETIANHLGVSVNVLRHATINFKFSPSVAIQKIDYLIQQGLSAKDILNNMYLLMHPKTRLEKAVLKWKDLSNPVLPLYVLLTYLRKDCNPKNIFQTSRHKYYVSTLLGISVSSFHNTNFFKPLWLSERTTIKHNFDFLISRGFSVEDIASCPILLAHNSEGLQKYCDNLWQRPDVRPFVGKAAWKDKKRVLNLVQFLIEKDLKFRSTVLYSKVEIAPDVFKE